MNKYIFLKTLIIFFLCTNLISLHAQQLYYPDADWQIKKPGELKMNSKLLDSAVKFALSNENKIDRDLRIADLKNNRACKTKRRTCRNNCKEWIYRCAMGRCKKS